MCHLYDKVRVLFWARLIFPPTNGPNCKVVTFSYLLEISWAKNSISNPVLFSSSQSVWNVNITYFPDTRRSLPVSWSPQYPTSVIPFVMFKWSILQENLFQYKSLYSKKYPPHILLARCQNNSFVRLILVIVKISTCTNQGSRVSSWPKRTDESENRYEWIYKKLL